MIQCLVLELWCPCQFGINNWLNFSNETCIPALPGIRVAEKYVSLIPCTRSQRKHTRVSAGMPFCYDRTFYVRRKSEGQVTVKRHSYYKQQTAPRDYYNSRTIYQINQSLSFLHFFY